MQRTTPSPITLEPGRTYPVISIRQPWAFLVCAGIKNVENRTWPLPQRFQRETVLIHAGKKFERHAWEIARECARKAGPDTEGEFSLLAHGESDFRYGGIVGAAVFSHYEWSSISPWAEPTLCHWIIERACAVPFMELTGQLGFWSVEYRPEAA